MLSYCLKCEKSTKSKNPTVVKTKSRRITLLSKCEVSRKKKQALSKGKKLEDH